MLMPQSQSRWADDFLERVEATGLPCRISVRVNGWPETATIGTQTCFVKSVTLNADQRLYFQGVDTKKLTEVGNWVLICGGVSRDLHDIFIIPWDIFFQVLRQGQPVNTYRPPREYWQYKFRIAERSGRWLLSVQGRPSEPLDVTKWRYGVHEAIQFLCGLSPSVRGSGCTDG